MSTRISYSCQFKTLEVFNQMSSSLQEESLVCKIITIQHLWTIHIIYLLFMWPLIAIMIDLSRTTTWKMAIKLIIKILHREWIIAYKMVLLVPWMIAAIRIFTRRLIAIYELERGIN